MAPPKRLLAASIDLLVADLRTWWPPMGAHRGSSSRDPFEKRRTNFMVPRSGGRVKPANRRPDVTPL
jgi:hypothetical protein